MKGIIFKIVTDFSSMEMSSSQFIYSFIPIPEAGHFFP